MSALPKAVQKQIDAANKTADAYYKALSDGAPVEPPAAGEPPAAPVEPPAAPPAGDTPVPIPQETFEQRYKVLQGKYNAEVPRMQRQLTEQNGEMARLRDQVTATQNLLASLNAQRTAADPAAARTPAQPQRLVKDEEIREFGPDLIDVVRRVAREEHATLLPEIDRRVAPVTQRVEQVATAASNVANRVSQSEQQSVMELLDEQVPNWQTLNRDAAFLNWLDQEDPYSRTKRGTMLLQAHKAHDGPRVVAFFTGFLKEHATVAPPPTPPAAAAPAAPAAPQKKLEEFVAPGTQKTGPVSTPDGSGKRVFTRAEISKFYRDVQAGAFKGKPDMQRQMESEVIAAAREGRVR